MKNILSAEIHYNKRILGICLAISMTSARFTAGLRLLPELYPDRSLPAFCSLPFALCFSGASCMGSQPSLSLFTVVFHLMNRYSLLLALVAAAGFVSCETSGETKKKKPAPPPPPGMENISGQPWNRPTKASEMGGTPFGFQQRE
jgi:hypothetical protein